MHDRSDYRRGCHFGEELNAARALRRPGRTADTASRTALTIATLRAAGRNGNTGISRAATRAALAVLVIAAALVAAATATATTTATAATTTTATAATTTAAAAAATAVLTFAERERGHIRETLLEGVRVNVKKTGVQGRRLGRFRRNQNAPVFHGVFDATLRNLFHDVQHFFQREVGQLCAEAQGDSVQISTCRVGRDGQAVRIHAARRRSGRVRVAADDEVDARGAARRGDVATARLITDRTDDFAERKVVNRPPLREADGAELLVDGLPLVAGVNEVGAGVTIGTVERGTLHRVRPGLLDFHEQFLAVDFTEAGFGGEGAGIDEIEVVVRALVVRLNAQRAAQSLIGFLHAARLVIKLSVLHELGGFDAVGLGGGNGVERLLVRNEAAIFEREPLVLGAHVAGKFVARVHLDHAVNLQFRLIKLAALHGLIGELERGAGKSGDGFVALGVGAGADALHEFEGFVVLLRGGERFLARLGDLGLGETVASLDYFFLHPHGDIGGHGGRVLSTGGNKGNRQQGRQA